MITIHFIEPSKAQQNAHIESFNGKFREECLNKHLFVLLRYARETIQEWRQD